jgi:uncharacterized protein YhaN
MESFFGTAAKATKNTAKRMSLAGRIAKLNVEMATQRNEKERHIKSIGAKVYAIFAKNKQLDGKVVEEEVASELSLIDRIDEHIEDLQAEITQLQAEFKDVTGSGTSNVVDASDVKETNDPNEK